MRDSNLEEKLHNEKMKKEKIIQQRMILREFDENCKADLQEASRLINIIDSSRYASQLRGVSEYYYNLIKSNAFDFQNSSMTYQAELKAEEETIDREIDDILCKIKKKKEKENQDS